METRRLGNSGLTVPVLGWGTVKLGRNRGVNYPDAFDLPSDAQVSALLDCALELGVNLIDTAPSYGSSEERLGRALRGRRNEVVLCSKVGERFDGQDSQYRYDESFLRQSVEESLVRLGTDHLDLLLLHSDGRDREILEQTDAVRTLCALRKAGVVRAVGMSAKTADGIRLAARDLDVVMAPLSLDDTSLVRALGDAAAQGCGVLAIKVLGQGHVLKNELEGHSVETALRFVVEQDFVHSAVLGSASAEHLHQWVHALQG